MHGTYYACAERSRSRHSPSIEVGKRCHEFKKMKKTTLLISLILSLTQISAQEDKAYTSLLVSYQNNFWLTHIPEGDTVFTGSNFQISNITYILNRERFNLGFGVGLSLSTSKYESLEVKEVRIPISIVQKIDLNMEPIVSYFRYAISKEYVLSSETSTNKGGDFSTIKNLNNNPISLDIVLGWDIKKKIVFELGYSFKQFSYEIMPKYAKHNLNIGIGLLLK